MKKIIFLFIASAILSLTTVQAQNIYAYDLKGGTVNLTTKQVTVSYKLNAAASSVVFEVPGYTVVSTSTAGLTKGGPHTVTLTLNDLPVEGGALAWQVKATGSAAPPASPANFSTVDKFYCPRNIAVDNSTDSPHFGNVYIVNTEAGTSAGTATQKGIYIYNPLMERQNTTAYAGSVSWNSGFDSPYGVAVAPDGKVYVTNGTLGSLAGGIYCMNPASPTTNFTSVLPAGQGVTPYCWVTGTGTNTKIYTMNIGSTSVNQSATAPVAPIVTWPNTTSQLRVYDIPALPANASTMLTKYNPGNTVLPSRVNAIAPGKDGGWWITQSSRTNTGSITIANNRTSPSLIYIDASGAVKYNSANVSGIHSYFNTMAKGSGGSIAVSPDGELIAVYSWRNNQNIQIFKIAYASDGTPTLTFQWSFKNNTGAAPATTSTSILSDYAGLSFDWANNIYVTDAGPETVKAWALPKSGGNIATTPAPASQSLKVESSLPYIDYYVPNPVAGKTHFTTLKDACDAINALAPISKDITLWVNGNPPNEAGSIGLINNTNHPITIKNAPGVTPVITFTKQAVNAEVTGDFIIGAKGPLNTDVAPAKNITLEGLTIRKEETYSAGAINRLLMFKGDCDNITVNNCTIKLTTQGNSATCAVYFDNNGTKMPSNVTIENCVIHNSPSTIPNGSTAQGIGFTTGFPRVSTSLPLEDQKALVSKGIRIENNTITTTHRPVFFSYVDGIKIYGNTISLTSKAAAASAGIMGLWDLYGDIEIKNNRFIALQSADNVSAAGIRGIWAGATGDNTSNATFYIDNNYISGFNRTGVATTSGTCILQGIRIGEVKHAYVRHNTFFMHNLTIKPNNPAPANDDSPTYAAINVGSSPNTIVNNIFVSLENGISNYFFHGNAPAPVSANILNVYCAPALPGSFQYASAGSLPNAPVSPRLANLDASSFEDPGSGNLQLVFAQRLNTDLGVNRLPDLTTNIIGEARNPVTQAGAFSFDYDITTDIGLVAAGGVHLGCLGNKITVMSDNKIQSVKLFNTQGRLLAIGQGALSVFSLTAPGKGIYIVETITENGRNITKVAVK